MKTDPCTDDFVASNWRSKLTGAKLTLKLNFNWNVLVLLSLLSFFCWSVGRYTDLQTRYNEAVNTVKEQKELIAQLETDLLSVNALPSAFRGQGEVRIVVSL